MSRLRLGAVAYDPKVVTIWDGFRGWARAHGLDLDHLLYSHYEPQVVDLIEGRIDLAWNSPLAWLRSRRLATARGVAVAPVVMRDTDRDLTSVIVVPDRSPVDSVKDLRGRVLGTGAVDSPQATLLPLDLVRGEGLEPGVDVTVVRFDVGVGLHGDHVGGERQAARALRAGRIDAACLLDAHLLEFTRDGSLPPGVRVVARTEPYDHCLMTAGPTADPAAVARFADLLTAMSYADPRARMLLDLEGLTRWLPGRTDRYAALERAVDASGFYDRHGGIGAADYRP